MSAVRNSVFTPEYDHLRAVLAKARVSAGLTQADLSRRIQRSPSHITLLESGQRRLEVLEMFNILEALGVDAADVAADLFREFKRIRQT